MSSTRPFRCVVDANVALKLFFVQQGSERADALFAHLEASPQARFHVPDFFYAECASAFATYVRQTRYPDADAQQDMRDLLGLALHVVPTADLATAALTIALHHHISGYDAFYVALSQRVDVPLITADNKLVRAMAGAPFQVHSLSVFEIPPLP